MPNLSMIIKKLPYGGFFYVIFIQNQKNYSIIPLIVCL
jgi:hypothetical protein